MEQKNIEKDSHIVAKESDVAGNIAGTWQSGRSAGRTGKKYVTARSFYAGQTYCS